MRILGKLWRLLRPGERRTAIALFGLLVVGMVLETIGVGLVIPALALLANQDLAAYPGVAPLIERLGNPSQADLITGGLLVLLGAYVIKALFLGFVAWRQAVFGYGLQASLSQRLFAGYVRQPWTFHLQRNSAHLIQNVTSEVAIFAGVVRSAMTVLTEVLVMSGIGMLLLFVEPVGAVVVISGLALTAWAFHRLTRTHLLRWGTARQYHEGLRIQHLQQGLGGAKDAKLLGREADVITQYGFHTISSIRVLGWQSTLEQLPRLWLEVLAVTGLVALGLVMLGQGKPPSALLPTLGLFAAAAFRLLPSANRLLNGFQSIRFALPVVDALHHEHRELVAVPDAVREPGAPFRERIDIEGVTFRYPGTETPALQDLSLSVSRGASVGFIGGSGAGKSTLVDVVLGLLTPEGGRVLADGVDIQSDLRAWQDQIGYVPQTIFLTDDTLRRNVAFGIPEEQIDDEAVRRAVVAAQLEEFIDSLPQGLDSFVGERGVRLSGGQRQRIGIARALYHDPAVLVLDEATSALDTDTERGVMVAVNALQGKKTLLIVAHRLSTVGRCDYLYRIEHGRVAAEGSFDYVTKRMRDPVAEPVARA